MACGIKEQAISKNRAQHNSATDTVRIDALLSWFVKVSGGQQLDIKRSSHGDSHRLHRKDPATKKDWKCRPSPRELFPHAAKVWQETPFSNLHSAQALRGVFRDYQPVAAGLSKYKINGWICLKDHESLEDFVRRVNDSINGGTEGTWFAASLHEPTVTPVRNMRELRAIQKEAVHALADEKRKQRLLKKENARVGEAGGKTARTD